LALRLLIAATAALLALLGPLARSEDWPQFRGPTGQGISREAKLPSEWSAEKNVVWQQSVPGSGWSSPIVVNGRVYLTSAVPQTGSDQSLEALCLEASSGKMVWQKEVFRQNGATAAPIHGKNSHASPTPICHGDRLYVHFGHQGTACLDLAGKILWRNRDFAFQPVHGNGGSPILVDDALIFSCDGAEERFIVALDRNTGKLLWKTDRTGDVARKFSFSTPLAITVKGRKQIVSPGSDAVSAYDLATGKEIWKVRYDGYSVIPRPVFGHGLVFICTGFNAPSLLAIRPDGEGDVTATHVAWQTRKGAPLTPSPLLVKDELYMISDNGIASCLDAVTGQVHWQERLGSNYSASPLYGDGKIYFQAEDGTAVVVRAGKRFEQLARNSLAERALASYAASENALFIRTEKRLYRIQESPR
jgi:outer membrane protein assembly factor BamB